MQHSHGASSSQPAQAAEHDVFLSHSGAQKGFVKDLYRQLVEYGFHPFLDVEYHSLPLAENFPERIFDAASSCKLALVVLSHEFFTSKWPMLELHTFVRAKVQILPLFFHLSPRVLKEKGNRKKWSSKWKSFAKRDARIKVPEWEEALKSLDPTNGIVYYGAASEGEHSFIERIVESIGKSGTLVPRYIYDTSHMQGRVRLHKIIADKFEEMGHRGADDQQGLQPADSNNSSQSSPPLVLGIYGLPGSGKSTLCRSLQGYFFPQCIPGKSLCLELPSRATLANLVDTISRTFNLNSKSVVTSIDEVIASLKNLQLWRKKMFLAVDNISDESCEVVRRILRCVIGPCSRVVLVARTLDLLEPALLAVQDVSKLSCTTFLQLSCIYIDSMQMPSINEKEATNLLLAQTEQHELDLMDDIKGEVLRVVQMSSFYHNLRPTEVMYLPLVVKTMGVTLLRYGIKDVNGWTCDQLKFWSSFSDQDLKIYREDVVNRLIWENFKELLDEQQQLLFLDAALFSQPLFFDGLDRASMLGAMHGDKDSATIEKLLKDLKRLCFIDGLWGYDMFSVHDVYVEFAQSIRNKKSKELMYLPSYIGNEDVKWDATTAVAMKLEQQENTLQRPVRAMSFELKEGCKTVDLKNFSSLKAVEVRNCISLVTFRMAGLTSLAILDITGFRELPRLECYDSALYASVRNVKRLVLESINGDEVSRKWQEGSSVLAAADAQGSSIMNLVHMTMKSIVPTRFMQQPSGLEIAKHMKGLQVLRMSSTGIRNLDLGSCSLPCLKELRVWEESLEGFRIGLLPALESLLVNSAGRGMIIKKRRKLLVDGKDLLKVCSDLQEVDIESDLFKNVGRMKPTWKGLRSLTLSCVDSDMEFEDLASSADTLEHLVLHGCEKLESVRVSAGELPNLRRLTLISCCRLVEVKFGVRALPSLLDLTVVGVSDDCVLSGLGELGLLLERLELDDYLSMLHEDQPNAKGLSSVGQEPNCSVSGLIRLESLTLSHNRPVKVEIDDRWASEIKNLPNLKKAASLTNLEFVRTSGVLEIDGRWRLFETAPIMNLANLSNLTELSVSGTVLLQGLDGLQKLQRLYLQYDRLRNNSYDDEDSYCLRLQNFSSSPHLTNLFLSNLNGLRCLDGVHNFTHLQQFYLRSCPLLEELPSLHVLNELRELNIRDCDKLKAVEGCDELSNLERVTLVLCKSMEKLPFKDVHALGSTHPHLQHLFFRGSRFAMEMPTKLMVEWAELSQPLCEASLGQLLSEYHYPKTPAVMMNPEYIAGLEEAILSCVLLLTTGKYASHGYGDYLWWDTHFVGTKTTYNCGWDILIAVAQKRQPLLLPLLTKIRSKSYAKRKPYEG